MVMIRLSLVSCFLLGGGKRSYSDNPGYNRVSRGHVNVPIESQIPDSAVDVSMCV